MSFTVEITITQTNGPRCFHSTFTSPTATDALVDLHDMIRDMEEGNMDYGCVDCADDEGVVQN